MNKKIFYNSVFLLMFLIKSISVFSNINSDLASGNHCVKEDSLRKIARDKYALGNYEESIRYNWQVYKAYMKNNDYYLSSNVLMDIGNNYLFLNKYDEAVKNYFLAIEIIDINRTLLSEKEYFITRGAILMNIGLVYQKTNNYNQALTYLYQSQDYFKKGETDSLNLAASYLNLGVVHSSLFQNNKAREYYQKAIDYYGEKAQIDYFLAITQVNLGDYFLAIKDYTTSLEHYNKALHYYNSTDFYEGEKASLLASIAKLYINQNDFERAKNFLDQSLEISIEKNKDEYLEDVYEVLVLYYTSKSDSHNAFINIQNLNKIKERTQHPEVISEIANIQKEFDYKRYKRDELQKIELIKKRQTLSKYRWYGAFSVLIMIVLIVLFLLYRIKNRWKVNKIKLENVELEKQRIKDKLEYRNSQLTSFAVHIVNKNEFLESLKKELEKIKKTISNIPEISTVISMLNQQISYSNEHKEFEIQIENQNKDFYYKLEKRFPNLTSKDKKLCSLILLGLTTKEIAALLGINVSSVEKSRNRLRKKLNIDSDTVLVTLFKSL